MLVTTPISSASSLITTTRSPPSNNRIVIGIGVNAGMVAGITAGILILTVILLRFVGSGRSWKGQEEETGTSSGHSRSMPTENWIEANLSSLGIPSPFVTVVIIFQCEHNYLDHGET